MTVTVTPEAFTMVFFDRDTIVSLTESLLTKVGLAGADVTIAIDERVPFGRHTLRSIDPVVIEVEGGALEDPKRLRHFSDRAAADTIGRLLLEAADRRDPAFGAPDLAADMSLPHRAAWEAYCLGRLERAGYDVQPARVRYAFRNRHGFTDAADETFDGLWSADTLTWSDLCARSDAALAVRDGAAAGAPTDAPT